jgi:hypothetical protein
MNQGSFLTHSPIYSSSRVASWFFFKPKIPIWADFEGPYVNGKMLIYFMAI